MKTFPFSVFIVARLDMGIDCVAGNKRISKTLYYRRGNLVSSSGEGIEGELLNLGAGRQQKEGG